MAFGLPDLQRLVNVGGSALECEDRFITGCVVTNAHLYADDRPKGLLRINNERYYQFLMARALMSSLPYRVDLEREGHDLALYASPEEVGTRKYAALGEIKRWMSPCGEAELPGLRKDIEKLKPRECPTFLLVITACSPGEVQKQLSWLTGELELPAANMTSPYCFRTFGWHARMADAGIVGYLLSAGVPV